MNNSDVVLSSQPNSIENVISNYETSLLSFIEDLELPTEKVLTPVDERKKVFLGIGMEIGKLDVSKRKDSLYISKFIAAAGAGLFDAALNYLWDETIKQLRYRVSQYDIQYFYDLAVGTNEEKRKNLKDEKDLVKLNDSELINAAKLIGLISEIGYTHLDYIKYMRNWASAAHPNQAEIGGFQLISWLETCIKEVIALPLENVAIEIKKLLKNIRDTTISDSDAQHIASFFVNLDKDKVNSLCSGFFGIYTRTDTTPETRRNINLLLPNLWIRVDEENRNNLGIKQARFSANGDIEQARLARDFLQIVNAESYLSDNIRIPEIKISLENLLSAHTEYNNFHTEPSFALQLERLIGDQGIPSQLDSVYTITLVSVFLTNARGVAWDADTIYKRLLRKFTQKQCVYALLSFQRDDISSKLQFNLCREKFLELLSIIKENVTAPPVLEMIDTVQKFRGPLENIRKDSDIKRHIDILNNLMNNM